MTQANTIDTGSANEEFPYPTNKVVAIIATHENLWDAEEALVTAGFHESEIEVVYGQAAADRVSASTGRSGIANIAIRLAEKIGLPNDETTLRRRYEEALRDGAFVIAVLAPTPYRKVLASQVIHDHGGTFIHFFGEHTFEVMSP